MVTREARTKAGKKAEPMMSRWEWVRVFIFAWLVMLAVVGIAELVVATLPWWAAGICVVPVSAAIVWGTLRFEAATRSAKGTRKPR